MLKSPPAQQQNRALAPLGTNGRDRDTNTNNTQSVLHFQPNTNSSGAPGAGGSSSGGIGGSGAIGGTTGSRRYSSGPSPQRIHQYSQDAASSCDADDEELPGDEIIIAGESKFSAHQHQGEDDVLDLSCKVKERDGEGSNGGSAAVKRGREDNDEQEDRGGSNSKKIRVEKGKRRILRKKKRDIAGGNSALVARPSVISFAGGNHHGDDGSSSSSGEDFGMAMGGGGAAGIAGMRMYRRRRRRVFVREDISGFDVDEHFRRSLGGVVWEQVVGIAAGGEQARAGGAAPENLAGEGVVNGEGDAKSNDNGGPIIINDSIKPSDVDDHFAKALGSETWSKIVANSSSSSTVPTALQRQPGSQQPQPQQQQVRSHSTSSNSSSTASTLPAGESENPAGGTTANNTTTTCFGSRR